MPDLKLHSLKGTCPIFKTRQIGFSQIKDRNTCGNSEITKWGQTFNEVAHNFSWCFGNMHYVLKSENFEKNVVKSLKQTNSNTNLKMFLIHCVLKAS